MCSERVHERRRRPDDQYTTGGRSHPAQLFGHLLQLRLAWVGEDSLIKIDYDTRQRAQQSGTLDQVYVLQHPLSLDCLLDERDPDSRLLDSLEVPSQAATPVCDSQKHEQVEALLSYLSPRAQTILRLRYGLVEGDERPQSEQEIAHVLDLSRYLVHTTVYDALLCLRALVRGQTTISKHNGKPCISLPGGRPLRLSPEREATLLHACHRIETEGRAVTVRLLAKETGLPRNVAAIFLRKLRGKTATSAQAEQQARLHRLEEAYRRLAAGKPPSSRVLAHAVQMDKSTALRFLRTQRQRKE